jgi:integrase
VDGGRRPCPRGLRDRRRRLRTERADQDVEGRAVFADRIIVEAGWLHVERTLDRAGDGQTFKEPKTERSRCTIDLPATVVAAVRAHHDRQHFERQAAGKRWQETGLVFATPIGTALDPANLLKTFKRHLKDAGLPAMRFQDLRQSAASMLLADGLPMNVVSDILGHTLTTTTVDIYAHVAPATRREAAAAMDRLLWTGCWGKSQAVGVCIGVRKRVEAGSSFPASTFSA